LGFELIERHFSKSSTTISFLVVRNFETRCPLAALENLGTKKAPTKSMAGTFG
jgi:hypothetical protein